MYASYTNEELRRVLATNPKDAEALVEAADRFMSSPDENAVEAAYDSGFEDGEKAGYDVGYAEGLEIGLEGPAE